MLGSLGNSGSEHLATMPILFLLLLLLIGEKVGVNYTTVYNHSTAHYLSCQKENEQSCEALAWSDTCFSTYPLQNLINFAQKKYGEMV
jgi:hypothetical protein